VQLDRDEARERLLFLYKPLGISKKQWHFIIDYRVFKICLFKKDANEKDIWSFSFSFTGNNV